MSFIYIYIYVYCAPPPPPPPCLGRAVSEDLKDSEEEVVALSGEVILVSHLPVSENLADEEGMKTMFTLIFFYIQLMQTSLNLEMYALLVPQILYYGLWAAGALAVFVVSGLLVAVLVQRAKPRPQPAPV